MTETFVLTDQQAQAVDLAIKAIATNKPMLRIGGFAGVGKSEVIREIVRRVDRPLIPCAYTGKAACVLRDKGIEGARTIHSCIYRLEKVSVKDPNDSKKTIVAPSWIRLQRSDLGEGVAGFIIDEASMVGKELLEDLMSFGLPIIAVGDPGQLPPVSENDVSLMVEPDFTLTEIHRQAAESGIIQLATRIRTEPGFLQSMSEGGPPDAMIVPMNDARSIADADIHICGFNKSRYSLNMKARRRLGYEAPLVPGERIVCAANNRVFGVFNGLMGTVIEIRDARQLTLFPDGGGSCNVLVYDTLVHWDGDPEPRPVPLSDFALGSAGPIGFKMSDAHHGRMVVADYGYALTCHRGQGSAWDRVVVLNEECPRLWDQARWAYTATTRAVKSVVLGARI